MNELLKISRMDGLIVYCFWNC